MVEKEANENGEEKPKKKRGGRKCYDLQEGDVRKFLKNGLRYFNAAQPDWNNPEEVNQRVLQYFQDCMDDDVRPSMAGLAMSLNITAEELSTINTGNNRAGRALPKRLSPETIAVLQKSKEILKVLHEDYMNHNKISPISAIFLGRNYYGLSNNEPNVSINVNVGDDASDYKALAAKYMQGYELPSPTNERLSRDYGATIESTATIVSDYPATIADESSD